MACVKECSSGKDIYSLNHVLSHTEKSYDRHFSTLPGLLYSRPRTNYGRPGESMTKPQRAPAQVGNVESRL